MKRPTQVLLAAAVLLGAHVTLLEAQASLVVLARHAEKSSTADTASLTPRGQHRAADLARVLAGTRLDAIISTQYARTRQTAAPAAGQAGLEPTIIPGGGSVTAHAAEMARAIDALPPGSAVLVVGHSNTLAPIIAALGGPKLSELCDLEYSSLLLLERASRDAAWRFMRVKYGAPDPAGADQCNATGESMRQGG